MARYTAVRRTENLRIPVAQMVFDSNGSSADFDGVASVLSDASYYLGGPRGGVAEAPFVHFYGPDSRLVSVIDLRQLLPARAAARRAALEAADAQAAGRGDGDAVLAWLMGLHAPTAA